MNLSGLLVFSFLRFLSVYAQQDNLQNSSKRKDSLIKEILLHTVVANKTNEFDRKGVEVICLRNNMCIAISSQFYQLQGIPFVSWDSLKFNDQCPDAVVSDLLQDARTLCTTEGFMTCGTEMSLNETHVVFSNSLQTYEIEDTNYPHVVVGSYNNHVVPWDCTYPLDYLVSLSSESLQSNFHYLPVASQIRQIIVDLGDSGTGYGRFHVGMFLYSSFESSTALTLPPQYNMDDSLYIGVTLLDGVLDAVVEVKQCWGTPTPDSNDIRRFVLIENYCPKHNFVKTDGNSMSRHFRWSSYVFRFKNSTTVYLHCEVEICFYRFQICNKWSLCPNAAEKRKRRSSKNNAEQIEVMSVGPLTLMDDVPLVENQLKHEEETSQIQDSQNDFTWTIVFGVVLVTSSIFLLILVVLIFRKLSQRHRRNR